MKSRRRNLPAATYAVAGLMTIAILFLSSLWAHPAHSTPAIPPPAPELFSPNSGETTTGLSDKPLGVPRLRWKAVPGALRYHIQISSSEGFATILEESDTYATEYTPYKRSYADGIYFWRVKSGTKSEWGNYSSSWSFNKDWTAGGVLRPNLITPANEAELSSFSEFTWSPVMGAGQYVFEINSDPSFPSKSNYSATTVKPSHTPLTKLGNNFYYWRVTPLDRGGNRGFPSEVYRFQLNWMERPQLLSPPHNPDPPPAFTPQFDWTAVEGAKYYNLEISTGADFSTVDRRYSPRNTSFTPDKALSNDQEYYWRIQAVDSAGNKGPYSEVRRFEIRWHLAPRLLTPTDNWVNAPNPLLSWAPVAGAHRYEVQVDETYSFAEPLYVKAKTPMTYYAPGNEGTNPLSLFFPGTYFWRVRAVDNQGNVTPWSDIRAFRYDFELSTQPIYPLFYYQPQADLMPVHGDPTVASPLFVWDTPHSAPPGYECITHFARPDYYALDVADNPYFNHPVFSITTATQGAAPTLSNPFNGSLDGQLYYWRIRGIRGGVQMGVDSIWQARFDQALLSDSLTDTLTPLYPPDGHETVVSTPILGWQPMRGVSRYRVQVSRDRDFNEIVDDAYPTFVNYVPNQGRTEWLPNGTYYWRVRAEQSPGDWSIPRYFNLSHRTQTTIYCDYPLTSPISTDPVNLVASDSNDGLGAYELTNLYVALDRSDPSALRWAIAVNIPDTTSTEVNYAFYIDSNHVYDSGAESDPLGHPISVNRQHRPEYVLYAHRRADGAVDSVRFWTWQGATWSPVQDLRSIGGSWQPHGLPNVLEIYIPYTALGTGNPDWPGSLGLAVFTTGSDAQDGIHDAIPAQVGTHLPRFAMTSDAPTPIYPFDTPLTNAGAFYDQPPMRVFLPYWASIDGYYTQVARDSRFTDLATTWEVYETKTTPLYSFLPNIFTPIDPLPDNETYYWRIRVRHERYVIDASKFDYSPYSRPFRFKLDSRVPSNLYVTPSNPVYSTPTFHWDRVEGAGVYRLQVDDDQNFSSPIIDKPVDLTSFTPDEMTGGTFADGTYYWRVAIKRDTTNYGKWSPTQTFTRVSPVPEPIAPRNDEIINSLPTFRWQPVLVPGGEPRRAAPRYRIMIDDDPNFSSSSTYDTDATSYTPRKNERYKDGTWYWKVAVLDAANHVGPYSPPQRFYKEYVPPQIVSPAQGSSTSSIPTFIWQPLDGAAYYKIQIDDNEFFSSPESYSTNNTTYTPVSNLTSGVYYWRVQMVDADEQPGPFTMGRLRIGSRIFLPVVLKNYQR